MNPVRELLKYTVLADRTVLRFLRDVAADDLVRPTGAGWGSVLGTMAHVLGAERLWLSRFVGNPLDFCAGPEDYPDLPSLEMGFAELWPELEMFIAGITPEQLELEIAWTSLAGESFERPLWQPVVHFANHSSHHRGQVVLMLRQLGYEPPEVGMF